MYNYIYILQRMSDDHNFSEILGVYSSYEKACEEKSRLLTSYESLSIDTDLFETGSVEYTTSPAQNYIYGISKWRVES